ncbi:OmpA family protein [Fulvivirgaceae bacterium BMA12]|uniref:OmpA family protein n=1 Tax=Agaribacillus aureus TaxID=3051825 RepID=A0ABT8LFG4_9BACT|nr:OmpA family protein [Fulvivirgaceae bacterium BMA12]
MFRKFCFYFLMTIAFQANSQEIQWASKVIEFSSELTSVQFSANQVLGRPTALPGGGENPTAWTPAKPNREEFIKVGFDRPMPIEQIAIGESFNPSTVKAVYAYDVDDKEYLIFDMTPEAKPVNGRMLTIFIDKTPYDVSAIKVLFDGKAIQGYFSIDAIGISGSKLPVQANVNLAEDIQEGIVPERLNDSINSPYKELRPLISPDGKELFFSRRNHPENVGGDNDDEDIWVSKLDTVTGEWTKAVNLSKPLNNKHPNFVSAITPDGKSVMLVLGNKYNENGKMAAGVSISTRIEDGWTEPKNFEIENDYNYSPKANYFIANNRKVLILSVERDDSYGDRDLYVSFFREDSTWSEPVNMGPSINTAAEESSPYLAADDKTLYFSSKGFSGYGKDDLFISRRIDDSWTNWTVPQNLGPDINSPEDDQFFMITPSGEYAYYSRGNVDTDLDIYRLKIPVVYKPEPVILVKGKVINAKTNEPVTAKIIYEQLDTGIEVGYTNADPVTGEYQILLPAGANYGFLALKDGFVPLSENIDLQELKEYKEIERDLYLVPLEVGVPFRLNNIFFDFDKSVLKKESFPELDRMLQLMNENPDMTFEVAGHTDWIGSDEYNFGLSQRRADAVLNYFLKNGINASRLSAVGYGESRPIATNATDEGRAKNRRVELIILEKNP